MGFEELKTIWDSQNDEELYTINIEALHAQIKHKSKSVNYKLNIVERMMFVGNLIVGIILFVDALQDAEQAYHYILPAMYIFFSIIVVILRRVRRKEERQFDLTIMGELDKAIWQINYLIKKARSMMVWYLLPLMAVLTATLLLDSKPLWALGTIAIVAPVSHFGGRWEINKWYLPKKYELESLRKKLSRSEEL